jgi:hypothetical protein
MNIIEYHTINHECPLVVLPYMKLCYLKSNVYVGYYVAFTTFDCTKFDDITEVLNKAILYGGEFRFRYASQYGMLLEILDSSGRVKEWITAWNFRWYDCIGCLCKIQRRAKKSMLARKLKSAGQSRDIFSIQNFILFKELALFPAEIMDIILDAYVNITYRDLRPVMSPVKVQHVETDTFREYNMLE